jgi:diguanylate cyclase (GGDEF)-like protein
MPAAPKLPLVSSPLATRDPVTGYYNREYFDYVLGEELRKSYQEQKPCSIIFFSIDEIKKIRFDNPDAGKDLIAQVTEQIGFFLKEGVDIPTCYGEDEFAIILPRTSSVIAFNLAEQIRETVAILTYGPKAEHVSVSLGISSYPDRTTHPDELVQQARSAMERAQAEGRNKSVLYTPD